MTSSAIPRKNLKPLGGLPLVAHSIRAALAANELDRVIVSTDDEEIAEVARAAGARVPWLRPAELAQDTTPTEPVVRHAIEQVTAERGRPDAVMLLQATSPVRHEDTLARARDDPARSGRRVVDTLARVRARVPHARPAGAARAD